MNNKNKALSKRLCAILSCCLVVNMGLTPGLIHSNEIIARAEEIKENKVEAKEAKTEVIKIEETKKIEEENKTEETKKAIEDNKVETKKEATNGNKVEGKKETTEENKVENKNGEEKNNKINTDNKVEVEVTKEVSTPDMKIEADTELLQSDKISVKIDKSFPRIIDYTVKDTGSKMDGQVSKVNTLIINKLKCTPKVTFNKINLEKAEYNLDINEQGIVATVKLVISVEKNIVNMNIVAIDEKSDIKVKTIDFSSNSLISVTSSDENSKITSANVWHILYSKDEYKTIKDVNGKTPSTIAILNNSKLVATVENNVLDKAKRVYYEKLGADRVGVYNGLWTYREIDSETVELPWSRVVISEDNNNDGKIDWQDGAIGYRNNMKQPFAGDWVKQNVSHVVMNFASQAQYPFLRATDNIKKYGNYIDDFGQMVLFKGYQSEGHDSAHPDYGGHFNERAGGVNEFNTMVEEAHKVNAKIGVHINATEYHPEANGFNKDTLKNPLQLGWAWLDKSYYVDRTKDILSGDLYKRLDHLKSDAPKLDWVYVDVYSEGNPWNEWKLSSKLNKNGWAAATEWSGPMEGTAIWSHWEDIGYGDTGNGTTSEIMRFIKNGVEDVFPHHPLLKGNDNKGFMGWEGDLPREKSLLLAVDKFYTWSLPTKYMQNFGITKWSDNEIDFDGGVKVIGDEIFKTSQKVYNPQTNKYSKEVVSLPKNVKMYKDGKLIYSGENKINDGTIKDDRSAKMISVNNKVFIPWDPKTEDKIYHWNDKKEATTWDIPNSWLNLKTVKLYKLDDLGRYFVKDIEVVNGKVTLNEEAKVPYILTKGDVEIKKTDWSVGSLVKDMGFNSYEFKNWVKEGQNTDNIVFNKLEGGEARGETVLKISGNNGAEGTVKQVIKGLKSGKTYTASVWAEATENREAVLGVKAYGGTEISNFIKGSDIPNYTVNSYKHGTKEQRIVLEFTMPEGSTEATLYLKAKKGTKASAVIFDDVRIVEKAKTKTDYVFYENFENVDEGWGPFVYGYDGPCQTHLSEKNKTTNDVIDGKFSLKSKDEDRQGEILRTVPGILRLESNKKYKLTFDYKAYDDNSGSAENNQFKVAIKSNECGTEDTLMSYSLPKTQVSSEDLGNGKAAISFETGNYRDAYIAIEKLIPGSGTIVIDNLALDNYDGEITVPEIPTSDPIDLRKISKATMKASVTSEQPGSGVAANVLDDNPSTVWHTKWDLSDALPQAVRVDFDKSYDLTKLEFLPRQEGQNGFITKYKVYLSNDNCKTWSVVEEGKWAQDSTLKTIKFDTPKKATNVKLEALEGVRGYASLAEFNAYGTDVNAVDVKPVEKVKSELGKMPNLPDKVFINLDDGSTIDAKVIWDYISPAKYSKAGIIKVDGKVQGMDKLTTSVEIEIVDSKSGLRTEVNTAKETVSKVVVGNEKGQYPEEAVNKLKDVITEIEEFLAVNKFTEEDIKEATSLINKALEDFNNSVIVNGEKEKELEKQKETLRELIKKSTELVSKAVVGKEKGQYSQEAVDAFKNAIEVAKKSVDSENSTLDNINDSIKVIQKAMDAFNNSVIKENTTETSEKPSIPDSDKDKPTDDSKQTSEGNNNSKQDTNNNSSNGQANSNDNKAVTKDKREKLEKTGSPIGATGLLGIGGVLALLGGILRKKH